MTPNEAMRLLNAAFEHGATHATIDLEKGTFICNKPLPPNVLEAMTRNVSGGEVMEGK